MTHIDPDAPRAGPTKPTDLEERAWLLARTTTRLGLARRVIALAEDIERLYERLGKTDRGHSCHCLPYGSQVIHVAPVGPLHHPTCHLYRAEESSYA